MRWNHHTTYFPLWWILSLCRHSRASIVCVMPIESYCRYCMFHRFCFRFLSCAGRSFVQSIVDLFTHLIFAEGILRERIPDDCLTRKEVKVDSKWEAEQERTRKKRSIDTRYNWYCTQTVIFWYGSIVNMDNNWWWSVVVLFPLAKVWVMVTVTIDMRLENEKTNRVFLLFICDHGSSLSSLCLVGHHLVMISNNVRVNVNWSGSVEWYVYVWWTNNIRAEGCLEG